MDMTKNVDVPLTNPSGDGSLLLSGDNTTGKGDGDDEYIVADLARVPAEVKTIVFVVTAFKPGVSFAKVEDVTCRVVDQGNGNTELGKFFPPIDSMQNAIVLGYVTRGVGGWNHTVVKTMGSGQGKQGIINLARDYLN